MRLSFLVAVAVLSLQLRHVGSAPNCFKKCKAMELPLERLDTHCKVFAPEDDLAACKTGLVTGEQAACVHFCEMSMSRNAEDVPTTPKDNTPFLAAALALGCELALPSEIAACETGFHTGVALVSGREFAARVKPRIASEEAAAAEGLKMAIIQVRMG